jgi:hypothetical protein
MVAQMLEAAAGWHSCDFEGFLDSDRQTGERPERIAAGALGVDLAGGGAGAVAIESDDDPVRAQAVRVRRREHAAARLVAADQLGIPARRPVSLAERGEPLDRDGGWLLEHESMRTLSRRQGNCEGRPGGHGDLRVGRYVPTYHG